MSAADVSQLNGALSHRQLKPEPVRSTPEQLLALLAGTRREQSVKSRCETRAGRSGPMFGAVAEPGSVCVCLTRDDQNRGGYADVGCSSQRWPLEELLAPVNEQMNQMSHSLLLCWQSSVNWSLTGLPLRLFAKFSAAILEP